MLHACFVPTILCFVYTLRHFYTFSGTNLLTRCHSASFCFLLFLVSEKLVKKYSRNWKNEDRCSYFSRHEKESKEGTEEGQEVATPPGGASPWPRRSVVWAPG